MQDYSDIGLNNLGFPTNAPIAQEDKEVSAYEFDTRYNTPTGAINYTKLSADSRAYTAVVSLSGEDGTFKDLQLAFDYVRRQGGGRILVLPGTYTIATELTIYSDTTIEGISVTDCIIDFNNTANNLTAENNGSDMQIFNLTFNNCTDANGAINTNSADRISIERCRFNNNTLDIYSNDSGHIRTFRCVSGAATPSGTFYKTLTPNALSWVEENEVYSCTSWSFQDCKQTNLINNYIQAPGTDVFYGDFDFAVISNTLFTQAGSVAAINFQNTNVARITGNDFLAYATFGTSNFVLVANNRFRSTVTNVPTITMQSSGDFTFTGNSIYSGTLSNIDGIFMGTECDKNIITGNVIGISAGTPAYAVNISDITCSNNVIVGNYLNANTADINDGGTLTTAGNNN